jgi:hypothetical protein
MAYTTINKSTEHFNTKLYTGTGSSLALTGVGFQPDFVWIKERTGSTNHFLHDAVRGVTKSIFPNLTVAEDINAQYLTAFGTDGFTVGTNGGINTNGNNYASWSLKANGSGSVDSSTGSISATVSANTTAGFSIIKFTNPSSGNFTIPHGLGVAPDMLFFKCTGGVQSWFVLHKDLTSFTDRYLRLQTNDSETTYTMQSQAPTSTLLYLNSGGVSNANTETICYAFASKTGYSKIGSYTGNNNSNGPFIYTGFKPALVITKKYDNTGYWVIQDNKRTSTSGTNPNDKWIYPNATDAEYDASSYTMDFLSNGFKIRHNGNYQNASNNYIYMAIGQSLVGSNNVPCTAR